jgi:hypothetical protein
MLVEVLEIGTLFQTEICRPQPFFFRDYTPRANGFKTILDHLIHLREPDLEDLSQDLLGRLELQGLWIAMHHGPLLWPDLLLKESCHSMPIIRVRLSTFAGKQYQ